MQRSWSRRGYVGSTRIKASVARVKRGRAVHTQRWGRKTGLEHAGLPYCELLSQVQREVTKGFQAGKCIIRFVKYNIILAAVLSGGGWGYHIRVISVDEKSTVFALSNSSLPLSNICEALGKESVEQQASLGWLFLGFLIVRNF